MKALCHFHVFAQSTFQGWQKIAPCVLSDIKAQGLVLLSHMAKHDPDLDLIFQALSDPTRRAMLARLGQGVAAVSALAQPTGLALPTVMRHLSVLEAAGLIVTERQAGHGCAVLSPPLWPLLRIGWPPSGRIGMVGWIGLRSMFKP